VPITKFKYRLQPNDTALAGRYRRFKLRDATARVAQVCACSTNAEMVETDPVGAE